MKWVVAFCVCCVLVSVGLLCWAAGVFPAKQAQHLSSPKRPVGGPQAAASEDGIAVYFSPNGGCTDAIVREISAAKQSVYVQAAQFTSPPIAKALVAAKKRGVDVRVVIDRKKDNKDDDRSQTDRLLDGGVPTFADGKHHTAHNKVIIIDHQILFTGSFNFTRESESENAENLLMMRDKPAVVSAYERNFKDHLAHSQQFDK